MYGLPFTKANCDLSNSDVIFEDCTIAPFYGLKSADSRKPTCKPKLMLDSRNFVSELTTGNFSGNG